MRNQKPAGSRPLACDSAVPNPRLQTIQATASILSVSPRSIWRLIATKNLTTVRIGRSVRITSASIDDFIAQGGAQV